MGLDGLAPLDLALNPLNQIQRTLHPARPKPTHMSINHRGRNIRRTWEIRPSFFDIESESDSSKIQLHIFSPSKNLHKLENRNSRKSGQSKTQYNAIGRGWLAVEKQTR